MNADHREASVRHGTQRRLGLALTLGVALGGLVAAAGRAVAAAEGPQARPADRDPGADADRRQQLRAHTRQLEQMLGPALNAELELARQTCGSLSPEARRQVLAAGREGVRTLAGEIAAKQFEGNAAQPREWPAVRAGLRTAVTAALRATASPEEFARYEEECRLRQERRQETARVRLVARVDEALLLRESQRAAVLADLRTRWDGSWDRVLRERDDLLINNRRPAPDYAERCIVPHLDPDQLREWRLWCQAANVQLLRSRGGEREWEIDGQGPAADPWWGR